MKNGAHSSLGWFVLSVTLVITIATGCFGGDGGKTDSLASTSNALTADGGVPAPPDGLTEASPDAAFISYGDSLDFAASGTGLLTVSRPAPAQLRIKSETRLPLTDSLAYVRGRIIAKFETVVTGSLYNLPVGRAYLWVRDTGSGHHAGTLFYVDSLTGALGRRAVVSQLHSAPRPVSSIAECIDLDVSSDTTRACCLCGNGQYNCPMSAATTMPQLEAMLNARGKLPRP